MSWSPNSAYCRSPSSSPESRRRPFRRSNGERPRCRDEWFGEQPRSRDEWFGERPRSRDDWFGERRTLADDLERRFEDLRKDARDVFGCSDGKVHHIPIRLENKLEEMKSRFRRKSPSPEEDSWSGPDVQELRQSFERHDEPFRRRVPDIYSKFRDFPTSLSDTWDRHVSHTLPGRKSMFRDDIRNPLRQRFVFRSHSDTAHPCPKSKHSRSFEGSAPEDIPNGDGFDSRPPPQVVRSQSETHGDPTAKTHASAFRSNSDGHCPRRQRVRADMPPRTYRGEADRDFMQNVDRSASETGRESLQEMDRHASETGRESQQETDRTRRTSRETLQEMDRNAPETGRESQQETDRTRRTSRETLQEMDRHSPETNQSQQEMNRPASETNAESLKEIASVLQNVEDLVQHIEQYSGTGRDKQFRFLDEMLTRCMLRLDDVDTEGREDVRAARRDAVRRVQLCVERLESRVVRAIPLHDVPRPPSGQQEQPDDDRVEQTKL